jgi:hypothetical protein
MTKETSYVETTMRDDDDLGTTAFGALAWLLMLAMAVLIAVLLP